MRPIIDIRFTIPAVAVVLPITLIVLAAALVSARRRSTGRPQLGWAVALIVYLATVVSLTLFPLQVILGRYAGAMTFDSVNLIPVLTIDARTFLLNILLFIPLGILIPITTRYRRFWSVTLAAAVLSLAIESIQLVTRVVLSSGRTPDINDLIANTLGAVVGYSIFTLARRAPAVARLNDM